MSIAITYETPETDEMGIRLTAKEMGIHLSYIPFRKISNTITNEGYSFRTRGKDYVETLQNTIVVLNRTQSKNRRLYAATILEALGKYVMNPSMVEYTCFSKLRTLLRFWNAGIRIPSTVYVPCDAHDHVSGTDRTLHNEEEIADLIQGAMSNGLLVVKPDAGTHGRMVRLAKNRAELTRLLCETEPSTINPVGFLAQEFIEKWFFDLRIIVAKKHGELPYCFPTALARAGFNDFRTNTYLGNMVFGVKLPSYVSEVAAKCGRAIGEDREAWVLALDAMLKVGAEDKFVDDEYVKGELAKLTGPFEVVKRTKRKKERIVSFSVWNRLLEAAYDDYMAAEAYSNVKEIIEESIDKSRRNILFHEANACPEFWEQTRLIAGVNLAEPLLECAESIINGAGQLPAELNTSFPRQAARTA